MRWYSQRGYVGRNFLVGYADDIEAVITARNTEEVQRKLSRVILRTQTWLDSHGLDLAINKTELLLITGLHITFHVDMSIGNKIIRSKSSVRYLGIRTGSQANIFASD